MKDKFLESSQLQLLLQQAQNGDAEALSEIVLSHQRLITKVVFSQFKRLASVYNKVSSSVLDVEDLLSIAQSAFIQAANAFSPSVKVKFMSYAATKIKFELFEQVKALQVPLRLPRHIFAKRKQLEKNPVPPISWSNNSFQAATYLSHSCELSEILETELSKEPDTYELYKNELLDMIQSIFSEQSRLLFALRIEGYSCKDIGIVLNIPQKRVSKIFRQIIGNTHNLEELEERFLKLKGGK